jgi:Zn finger protein HypA/HybF involved in hydrogenase expression
VSLRLRAKSEDVEEEDELEVEELKEKRREMRKLKMERDLLKMQAEAEKVRQELEKYKASGVSSNPDSQAVALGAMTASLIKAGVKPEQANEFFSKMNPEALAILSSLTSSNPYLPVFMFLASQSRGQSSQSVTPKDVIELNKSVFDLAKDIGGRGKGEGETASIVKSLADMVKDLYQQQLLDKLDEVKNAVGGRSSVWEEVLEDDKKFSRFKELFGGGTAKPEIQIQLEQLRQQHELNLKKLDLEMLKLRSELLESRRKSKMFSQALRKMGEAIGEGLGEASESTGTEAPLQYNKQMTVKCPKCGADIPNVTPDAEVVCPSCKTIYKVRTKGK